MSKRQTAEKIIRILGEIENSGLKVSDVCRPHNISEQTYFRWRKKYGGVDVNEAARLRALEEENSRLKRLVAEQALDIQILKEVNSKKSGEPRAEEIKPASPWENGHVESFHASLRPSS